MDPALQQLMQEVEVRAAAIGAPRHLLPTFGVDLGGARPHVMQEGETFRYVVHERGQALEDRRSRNIDEILYWIFDAITFEMASSWELHHRDAKADVRLGLFTKQLELLDRIDPDWVERSRRENAHWHDEAGL